ncbi:uncharacterized protein LOC116429490 [Nomia melanderi]|uniref:uncharacterized protein LOC116429490 n=1 Tax=Nomia melanderi TaxID=2448451 RepID=UPI003FCE8431
MLDETEQHQIQPLTVEDINLEHTCDPDIFKIDNVFSDFSLRDIGLETRFKKKIKKWATKQRRELLQSSSRENQQSNIPVDNQPDQHIEQTTETRRKGRLRSVSYSEGFLFQ